MIRWWKNWSNTVSGGTVLKTLIKLRTNSKPKFFSYICNYDRTVNICTARNKSTFNRIPIRTGSYQIYQFKSEQDHSIQFKETLLVYNDYGTQIYAAVNSLFSDTKKTPQSLSQKQKTENDDIHTNRFRPYMEGIVPLWTLTLPPPRASQTPCFYLVHAHL